MPCGMGLETSFTFVFSLRPDVNEATLKVVRGQVSANEAKGRVRITRAGLGDTCCVPSGIAALYNNLPADRRSIVWVQGSKHGYIPPQPNQRVELPSGSTK